LTAKHLYLIKVSYGNRGHKFFIRFSYTTISLDLMDKNKRCITRVDISPKIFSATHKSNQKRGIKGPKLLLLILQQKYPIIDLSYVKICHDCRDGNLFVYRLTIIDLITKDSYSSIITSFIKYFSHEVYSTDAQTYVCNLIGKNTCDIKPSPVMTILEMSIFLVCGLNAILFDHM
jgi:hypothetical protein